MGLYKKFDDAVMYCVNKGVKAWNWTTGGTKTSLANGMLSLAPIPASLGNIWFIIQNQNFLKDFIIGIATSGMFLYSYYHKKRNSKQETEELKALKDGLKLPDFKYNRENKIFGFWWTFGVNSIGITKCLEDEKYFGDDAVTGMGMTTGSLYGFSHYVMRAENLPPRKNVLSRTADKIREKLAERKLQPSPNPSYGLERLVRYE